jgi:hypothetical protein
VVHTSKALARVRPAIPPPAMMTLRLFAMIEKLVCKVHDVE